MLCLSGEYRSSVRFHFFEALVSKFLKFNLDQIGCLLSWTLYEEPCPKRLLEDAEWLLLCNIHVTLLVSPVVNIKLMMICNKFVVPRDSKLPMITTSDSVQATPTATLISRRSCPSLYHHWARTDRTPAESMIVFECVVKYLLHYYRSFLMMSWW